MGTENIGTILPQTILPRGAAGGGGWPPRMCGSRPITAPVSSGDSMGESAMEAIGACSSERVGVVAGPLRQTKAQAWPFCVLSNSICLCVGERRRGQDAQAGVRRQREAMMCDLFVFAEASGAGTRRGARAAERERASDLCAMMCDVIQKSK